MRNEISKYSAIIRIGCYKGKYSFGFFFKFTKMYWKSRSLNVLLLLSDQKDDLFFVVEVNKGIIKKENNSLKNFFNFEKHKVFI